ncbi:methyl-accepting chemotaxis protein [Ponticaulis sp.]|uniref:methyl-accepting chemotaxis protein n=1 Tax=Ponticaulis sp. TaxID=2020902 RepID=UPI000B6BA1F9|nr:methyl-accepting chemotaxis protein [Ponticaulis sp.]MAJ08055.1 methyl-accepting chemotaxis protein [Ponticaulis sp.]RPG18359.1 MAG: methyl-accepting chemotaxis protein [Hyphomonadaceae bacterium TMED125]HBH91143.1 methyl-accepting chemotaxis protein [Hyphomonadaceae bacterium]|tara:strand:- start:1279 stop:2991 length:1713 start_codon:yes stop_codon:yes gene_type:complete
MNMIKNMKVSSSIAAMSAMLVAASLLIIWAIAYEVVSLKVRQDTLNSQSASLRVAATVLSQNLDEFEIGWDGEGEVRSVRADTIPEFRSHDLIDSIGQATGETATVFVWDDETRDFWRRSTNIVKPDGNRAVGTPLGQNGAVYPIVTRGETFRGEANILGTDYYTVYQPIESASGDVIGILYVGVQKARITGVIADMMIKFGMAVVPVILIAIVISIFASRRLLRPVRDMAQITDEIARENLSISVPHTGRKDEIGQLAASVTKLQQGVRDRHALAEKQKIVDEQARERQHRMEQMIASFRDIVMDELKEVSATAHGLDSTADTLSQIARNSADRASESLGASGEATNNVQSVASAAEELTASIGEIGRQVVETTRIVASATENGRETNTKIERLAQAAGRIGEVVTLIQAIAEQTNLLALNATIEAARAGGAGKGFAVVASEVKQLATQTAKATEEISAQISAIQDETNASVQAIADITTGIEEMNSYTSAIASAIEEQGSATAEISGSVQRAAEGTGRVSQTMSELSSSVDQTTRSANEVLGYAGRLNERTSSLKSAVERFLDDVAAA